MNIVVLQENLSAALTKTSKFLPSKASSISSVNNFLLTAQKGVISLKATDLETEMTAIIAGKIDEEGEVVLPAKPSLSLFSLFPGEKIIISTDGKGLLVKGESSDVSLNLESSDLFPQDSSQEKGKNIVISIAAMREIMKKNGFCVSTDQARSELTGVLFSLTKQIITLVSTDGFRLSVLKEKVTSTDWEGEVLLPLKAIRAFSEVSQEGTVKLVYYDKEKKVAVVTKQEKIITRLIQGAFPDYKKIIPSGAQTIVSIEREGFLRAVKISSVFARESANIVRLSIKGALMTVSANAAQTGKNKTDIPVKKEGEDIEIAFNYRFLLDMLGAIDTDTIVFESNGPLSPGVFHYGNKDEYFHIIMPVRLQDSK